MPRERLDEAFRRADYVPHDTRDGIVVYRAASFVKRLLLRFDDAVTVRRDGADLEMEGARRVLVRIATHVESNTANDHE